jgi:hypothetical protein
MSTPTRTWLTPEMVATYLGDPALADEPNLVSATNGVAAYIERVRSDIFGPAVNPLGGADELIVPSGAPRIVGAELVVGDDVVLGATMWAAHVFQLRSAPSGYTSYGDGAGDAMGDLALASNRGDIYRLTGIRRPVAY